MDLRNLSRYKVGTTKETITSYAVCGDEGQRGLLPDSAVGDDRDDGDEVSGVAGALAEFYDQDDPPQTNPDGGAGCVARAVFVDEDPRVFPTPERFRRFAMANSRFRNRISPFVAAYRSR